MLLLFRHSWCKNVFSKFDSHKMSSLTIFCSSFSNKSSKNLLNGILSLESASLFKNVHEFSVLLKMILLTVLRSIFSNKNVNNCIIGALSL